MQSQKVLIILGILFFASVYAGGDRWTPPREEIVAGKKSNSERLLVNCKLNDRGHPTDENSEPCESGRCEKTKVVFHSKHCCCIDWPSDREKN